MKFMNFEVLFSKLLVYYFFFSAHIFKVNIQNHLNYHVIFDDLKEYN